MRDRKFSPNHVSNDAIIIRLTAEKLREQGFDVKLMSESEFVKTPVKFDAYLTMGRNDKTLEKLAEIAKEGSLVVNSPKGVYNAFREALVDIFNNSNVPIPKSVVVNASSFDPAQLDGLAAGKLWLKRENHTLHREDVTPIYSMPELVGTIKEFKRRGIKKSVVQEHKVGSEVKFYGVRGTDFFSWYYVNGLIHNKFNEEELISISNRASELTDVLIYGGDAIISDAGEISIIDFNDWPSFAPVKEEASSAIARLVSEIMKNGGI